MSLPSVAAARFQATFTIMSRVLRFLLYWLAVLAGVTGVLVEGVSLLKNWKERLFDPDYSPLLSSYDFFSAEVIFLLSLVLLIAVHIGHVVGGGLHFSRSRKPAASGNQPGDAPPSADSASQSREPLGASAQTDKETADEKLTRLLKQKKEGSAARDHPPS